MNHVAEEPRSKDNGPLLLILPRKRDDMALESSGRLEGKISALPEGLSMFFSRFERPINEKELNLSILSRGKEILDQLASVGILPFSDTREHCAPFLKIYRPAIVRIH